MQNVEFFDDMVNDWKDNSVDNTTVKDISVVLNEMLKLLKMTNRMGFETIAGTISILMRAIDSGNDDVSYVFNLLYDEYIEQFFETGTELKDGELNLFDENGKRLTLNDI